VASLIAIAVAAAEFDPRHVPQAHLRPVRQRAQDDVLELVGAAQPRLRADRGIQFLPRYCWQCANLPGGDLGVLRLHRVLHVERRQLKFIQLVRIEPDPH